MVPPLSLAGHLSSQLRDAEAIPLAALVPYFGGAALIALGVGGSGNAITVPTPSPLALTAGQTIYLGPTATNTGATTLARDGLTAKNVFQNGPAPTGGRMKTNGHGRLF